MKLRINENEVTNTYYGVFETGGSIGSHKEDDFYGRAGSKTGKLIKVFNNDTDAKEYAKRMRKSLSPGERKYYGCGYFTKPLTPKDIQNSVVQTIINNRNVNESVSGADIVEFSTEKEAEEFCRDNIAPYNIICNSGNKVWIKREDYDKYYKESFKKSITDAARYFLSKYYNDDEVWEELDEEGWDDEYIQNVINKMNELFEEEPEDEFDGPYAHIW